MLARSTDDRRTWTADDFQFLNQEVYSVAIDTRHERPRIFAGVGNGHWGPLLTYSDDLGKSWTEPDEPPIGFPPGKRGLGRPCLADPAGDRAATGRHLRRSRAACPVPIGGSGESFSLVRGPVESPRPAELGARWWRRLSAYRPPASNRSQRRDGRDVRRRRLQDPRRRGDVARGQPRNPGARIVPEDQRFPEFGQCVHKVAFHRDHPQRLFAQNHFGVYRSDDRGDSWTAIESGPAEQLRIRACRPSPPARHAVPFPLQADAERFPSGRQAARLPNRGCGRPAGRRWRKACPPTRTTLPILRDAMVANSGDPAGVYFGTRLGEVYASRDDGDSWSLIASHLPDILSVRVAEVA